MTAALTEGPAARGSRRPLLLQSALVRFAEVGFEAVGVAELADATGMSKSAVSYHFPAKDDLLVALAAPLLDEIEVALDRRLPADGSAVDLDGVRDLLGDLLDVLLRRRLEARWFYADPAVRGHEEVGARLAAANDRLRTAVAGGSADEEALVQASAVIGGIWRPVALLASPDPGEHRDALLDVALAGARVARSTR